MTEHTPHPHHYHNANTIHQLELEASTFNQRLAVWLTQRVGNMLNIRLPLFGISQKGPYSFGAFFEISKCCIAATAQERPNLPGLMVMIYGKGGSLACTRIIIGLYIPTASAGAILISQHLPVLRRGKPIFLTPVLWPSILCCSAFFVCMAAHLAHALQSTFCATVLCKLSIRIYTLAFVAMFVTLWHKRFDRWVASFFTHFTDTSQSVRPKSCTVKVLGRGGKLFQASCTLFVWCILRYDGIHDRSLSLLSSCPGLFHQRQDVTLLSHHYTINPPVEQLQGVVCLT